MKKIINLLVFIVCTQTIKAQIVTIPDANFVTWLQANIPSAMVGNQMNISDPAVTGRNVIDIYNLQISSINGLQYFSSLRKLNCSHNQITNLTFLPNSLDTLICGQYNALSNLTGLPSSLKYLDCSSAGIGNLGALPSTLEYLDASQNNINTISVLPPNLKHFMINYNNFLIPNFVSGFILPNTLRTFSCGGNSLTTLPSLPNSLEYFVCSENNLSSLPPLPPLLTKFGCSQNQLTSLPQLPDSLRWFFCSDNPITSIPNMPNKISILYCENNQLTSLPAIPDSIKDFRCPFNLITCFPQFPNNVYDSFIIDGNPFSCLPNYVQGMEQHILNYPLCVSGNTTTNTNNCTTTRGITGYAYLDANFNCIKNNTESGVSNGTIKLYDNSNTFVASTNIYSNGFYYFDMPTGSYRVMIDTSGYPFTARCNGIDSLVSLSVSQTAADSIDFSVICKPGFDVGVQSISTFGLPFPGTTHTLTVISGDMIHWYNFNCASGISGTLSFLVNGPVTYVGPAAGALTPSVSGNIYTYNISDFGTINNSTDFKLVFQIHTTAQAGDAICINATVTPVSGDNNINNNIYNYCYNVVNSFDPNIKEVYPIAVQTGFNDWLTYTIHFQNTGNAPAMNIRLEDQLDAELDPETFQLINYSHYNMIDVTGNHLTVRFPNIQLADSTSNPSGSIGFVQYRIKPKASWVNDTIKNSAEIYFDYNAPIVTNTAKSYFMTTTGINEISVNSMEINLVPNPTNGLVTINSKLSFEKVELLSITGQILLSEPINAKTHELHLQNYAEGIYFVKVIYPNGLSIVKKVVRQ